PDEDADDLPFVEVYFVRSHESGFWVEPERHQLDAPTEGLARAAMEVLFSAQPHDPELTSLVPDGVEVLDVNLVDGLLTVDVSGELAAAGGASAQEVAFSNQFVHTATAFDTVDAVELWIDGEPIDGLWGHVDFSQPIEPDPFALSPITITSPPMGPDGATADAGEVVLGGEATVFEATFLIRILDGDGAVVEDTFVTASMGGPERGTWEHTVTLSEPGTYTVEVMEDDPSDGEGRPPFVSTRTIEVG
ncbi:MAG: GerMN domain-containing protein, partial [Intrasporangiaceae bacterium]|nr:GerMN domain-containing protein [Intrasporangiaceae bacterium]